MPDNEEAIEAFVTRMLHALGATVKQVGFPTGSYLRATLAPDAARLLGCRRQLTLSFQRPPQGSAVEGGFPPDEVEFITYGHPLFDRMIRIAQGRGRVANLMFTFGMDPAFVHGVMKLDPFGGSQTGADLERSPLLDEMCRQAQKVVVDNGRIHIAQRRIVHERQLLFSFKVAMLADEKREMTVALLIDPLTERVARPVDISRAVSFGAQLSNAPSRATSHSNSDTYTVQRLYRTACAHLETRLKGRLRTFEAASAERLNQETRRIQEYYRGLAAESLEPVRALFRRIADARTRLDVARSWHTQNRYYDEMTALKGEAERLEALYRNEVEVLEREEEQRLQEVREKYRPRAEIALVQAACVRVPRIEWCLQVRRGTVHRETTLTYDALRRRFVDWECESCQRPLIEAAHLCSCEALVCSACHVECRECGTIVCSQCQDQRCHVCGQVTCPTCDATCPLVNEDGMAIVDPPAVCRTCRRDWCDACRGMIVPSAWAR